MEPTGPLVTVVVATYNRPDALIEALSSLCCQTMERWLAWVVGDCCDPRTEAVVRALADPRIRYVNLPQRCGDQSGPNSIGAALCRTPYLAFLNHDDVMLKDHLERAVAELERTGTEFYLGQSWYVPGTCEETTSAEQVVVRRLPKRNHLWQAAYRYPSSFEPASAWVLRADAFRRVGDWRDGFQLFGVPMRDWLLRAAYAGVRIVNGEAVTVVKVGAQNCLPVDAKSGSALYNQPATVLRLLAEALAGRDADTGRIWLEARALAAPSEIVGFVRFLRLRIGWCLRLAGAVVYRITGQDPSIWLYRCLGRKPGDWKRRTLRNRTQERLAAPADLAALKRFAQTVAESYDTP